MRLVGDGYFGSGLSPVFCGFSEWLSVYLQNLPDTPDLSGVEVSTVLWENSGIFLPFWYFLQSTFKAD